MSAGDPVASPAHQEPQPEIAWLIERKDRGFPEWWTGHSGPSWTDDPHDVVRFARQQDAQTMIRFLWPRDTRFFVPMASEHLWG